MDQKNTMGIRTPFDLIERVKQMEQEVGEILELEVLKFKPKLIVNQVRTKNDIQIGFSMKSACRKYFGIDLEYLGYVEYDDSVWQSIRSKRPLAVEYPFSRRRAASSASYTTCSGKSSSPRACSSEESAAMVKKIDDMNFYELLEISPAPAPRTCTAPTTGSGVSTTPTPLRSIPLFTPEETARIRLRIEDAYRTLVYEESRKEYNRMLKERNELPEPEPPASKRRPVPAASAPVQRPPGPDRAEYRAAPPQTPPLDDLMAPVAPAAEPPHLLLRSSTARP